MISREVILDLGEERPADVESTSSAEEMTGSPGSDPTKEGLPHTVLDHDDETVKDGQLLASSADYSMGSFTPDLLFEQLCTRYQSAKRLYGETIIRELTGFEPDYIAKNRKIREFQDELKQHIAARLDEMKERGLLDTDGKVTEEGWRLASLVLYSEELDELKAKHLGRLETKERAPYGDRAARVPFSGHRYKDVDVRASIHKAIRRNHPRVERSDLVGVQREQQGSIGIVYAIDASGSMRGEKLHVSKKAGIALAFRACEDGNDPGLVVFTNTVQTSLPPSRNFADFLHALTKTRAGSETDISVALEHATALFPKRMGTKHLVLITDALPTTGKSPGKDTLTAVALARDAGVTVSLVGINLEKEGEKLAKQIVELGNGRLYRVKNLEELDLIVLEDYEELQKSS